MDGFSARSLSKRTHLHFLGLLPSALAERLGIAYRPSVAQRRLGAAPPQCWSRSLGARPATCKRSRADLDRAGYEREEENSETSAHRGLAKAKQFFRCTFAPSPPRCR